MAQLAMVHRNPSSVPPPAAPDGFILRSYREGDDQAWADIVNATDMARPYDVANTKSSLTRTPCFDPKGLFFVCEATSGKPVATACAYWSYSLGLRRPALHMVAGLPRVAGKGLGGVACQAVLNYFARRGEREVILTTDDHRIPAIIAYLRLGFEPMRYHRGEDHRQRWQAVQEKIAAKVPGPLRFA
jgi:RimJ/RimL family protein N-acetyltransferase